MKPLEIKGARARLGFTQKDVADKLGISLASYQKKECGSVRFSDDEKVGLTKVLGLSADQMNEYLYDGKLPI